MLDIELLNERVKLKNYYGILLPITILFIQLSTAKLRFLYTLIPTDEFQFFFNSFKKGEKVYSNEVMKQKIVIKYLFFHLISHHLTKYL